MPPALSGPYCHEARGKASRTWNPDRRQLVLTSRIVGATSGNLWIS